MSGECEETKVYLLSSDVCFSDYWCSDILKAFITGCLEQVTYIINFTLICGVINQGKKVCVGFENVMWRMVKIKTKAKVCFVIQMGRNIWDGSLDAGSLLLELWAHSGQVVLGDVFLPASYWITVLLHCLWWWDFWSCRLTHIVIVGMGIYCVLPSQRDLSYAASWRQIFLSPSFFSSQN